MGRKVFARKIPATTCLRLMLLSILCCAILTFPETIAELEQQLKQAPDEEKSAILNQLVTPLRRDKQVEKALEYGKKALALAQRFKQTAQEIHALSNIARALTGLKEYDRARQYAGRSMTRAEESNNKEGILKAMDTLITVHANLPGYPDNFPGIFKKLDRMILICREIGDKEKEAWLHMTAGNIYQYFKGDVKNALVYRLKALELFRDMGDFSHVVFTMGYLGILYSQIGDNEKALHYYLNGIRILEEKGGNSRSGRILLDTSEFYKKLKNYDKSEEYLKRAIEFYKKQDEERYLVIVYQQMGDLLMDIGEFDRALSYLNLALKAFMKHYEISYGNNPFEIYLGMGQVYEKKNDYQNALSRYNEALKIAVRFNRDNNRAYCLRHIGEIRLKMNDLKKARENFDKSLQLAKGFDDAALNKDNYKLLSQVYAKEGKYKKALEYYQRYADLKDKIYSEESAKSMAEMQTRYETEKKEQEIESLKQQEKINDLSLSRQRIIRNISIAGFVLVILIMAYFVKKYYYILVSWKKKHHVGRYRMVDKIATGGMGVVYKAHDMRDKTKTFAIKVLKDEYFEDETYRKRFKIEALLADRLDHPNIIKIIERGESDGNFYITMELLQGKPLDVKLREEGRLSLPESLHVMIQVADALSLIHSKDIVHRDLKPANIMLIEKDGDANFVKLLDFGLAKMKLQTKLTRTGMLVGTLNYLPPEYMADSEFSSAGDVYSLGVTFYEIMTGKIAFPGDTAVEIMRQILDETPAEPRQFCPDIPAELNDLIKKMLEKKKESRPDIDAVLASLKKIQARANS